MAYLEEWASVRQAMEERGFHDAYLRGISLHDIPKSSIVAQICQTLLTNLDHFLVPSSPYRLTWDTFSQTNVVRLNTITDRYLCEQGINIHCWPANGGNLETEFNAILPQIKAVLRLLHVRPLAPATGWIENYQRATWPADSGMTTTYEDALASYTSNKQRMNVIGGDMSSGGIVSIPIHLSYAKLVNFNYEIYQSVYGVVCGVSNQAPQYGYHDFEILGQCLPEYYTPETTYFDSYSPFEGQIETLRTETHYEHYVHRYNTDLEDVRVKMHESDILIPEAFQSETELLSLPVILSEPFGFSELSAPEGDPPLYAESYTMNEFRADLYLAVDLQNSLTPI